MKNLFKSQTSYEILDFLSQSIGKSYSLGELTDILEKDKANISRELQKLVEEDLVLQSTTNARKTYSLNMSYKGINDFITLLENNRKVDFKEKFDHKWLLGEDIPNIDPYFSKIWLNCFVDKFDKPSGKAYKQIAAIYKDYHLWFYFIEDDAHAVAENIVNRFVDEPGFMKEVNTEIVKHSDILSNFVKTIPEENLELLSDKELWNINQEHIDLHTEYYRWAWIPVASDMFSNILTDKSKDILRSVGVKEDMLNDYMTILTQPTRPSLIKLEQDELALIGVDVQSDSEQLKLFKELFRKFKEEDVKEFGLYTHSVQYEEVFEKRVRDIISLIDKKILDALQNHYTKYFYSKFIYTEEQGVYSFDYYLKELVRIVNSSSSILDDLQKDREEFDVQLKEKKDLIKTLGLNNEQKEFFHEWGEFMVTKIYRRFAQLHALYRVTSVVREIGNRLDLTLKQTRFMKTDDMKDALLSKKSVNVEELNERIKSSVYFATKDTKEFLSGPEAEKAIKIIRGADEDFSGITELTGQTGARGYAKGEVKIVNHSHEMDKVKKGDILVSISTQPDLLPAMKKAAAFVTEQGGVTSHAAIVAREMNTPCVIGTKIATKVLKDGMMVEVDATKGIVKILE